MNKNNNIEDIFKNKLKNFESTPPSNAWANIQSQINTAGATSANASAAAKSLSSLAKILITSTVVIATGTASYFILNTISDKNELNNSTENKQLVKLNDEKINELTIPSSELKATEQNMEADKLTHINASKNNDNLQISSEKSINTFTNDNFNETKKQIKEIKNESNIADKQLISNKDDSKQINEENKSSSNTQQTNTSNSIEEEKISSVENNSQEDNINSKKVINTNQAKESLSETTIERNTITEETKQPELKISPIPNVITPNHDGVNDIIKINAENYTEFKAQIFDLNGQLIFEWDTPTGFWDGYDFSGNELPKGNYALIVTVKDLNGKTEQLKSFITLYK
jgi:gliding motility-associated-like protein